MDEKSVNTVPPMPWKEMYIALMNLRTFLDPKSEACGEINSFGATYGALFSGGKSESEFTAVQIESAQDQLYSLFSKHCRYIDNDETRAIWQAIEENSRARNSKSRG